ncbi:MAG: hypothetical protein KC931_19585, partial [Candidatus Omnitrophica bacterium]|nr:hypothetical protein [Candidatus Omnitrophota bacterium]
NRIRDLTPLSGLQRLWALWIIENPVEDLSPILSLGNVHDLKLDGAQKNLPSCEEVLAHIESIKKKKR